MNNGARHRYSPRHVQNRVTPLSELVADPGRGLVYGNRGCLHDSQRRIRRRYNGRRWIACRLEFRGWQRGAMMQPGRFTELFFLDEATAFAAGHRPCALCRRQDYNRFGEIWRELHPGQVGADAVDAQLQVERIDPVTQAQRRHRESWERLPDGAFVLCQGRPYLVLGRSADGVDAGGVHRSPPTPGVRSSCDRLDSALAGLGAASRVGSGRTHASPVRSVTSPLI